MLVQSSADTLNQSNIRQSNVQWSFKNFLFSAENMKLRSRKNNIFVVVSSHSFSQKTGSFSISQTAEGKVIMENGWEFQNSKIITNQSKSKEYLPSDVYPWKHIFNHEN